MRIARRSARRRVGSFARETRRHAAGILTDHRAFGHRSHGRPFGDLGRGGGNVPDDPVRVVVHGASGMDVGVVHQEHQSHGRGRRAAPCDARTQRIHPGHAAVFFRQAAAVGERRDFQPKKGTRPAPRPPPCPVPVAARARGSPTASLQPRIMPISLRSSRFFQSSFSFIVIDGGPWRPERCNVR